MCKDDTGVREALCLALGTLEAIADAVSEWAWLKDEGDDGTLETIRAALSALAPQPPKAETPAGVGDGGPIPPAAYFFAVEKWGSAWVRNELASLREFAALSTAPAARPVNSISKKDT